MLLDQTRFEAFWQNPDRYRLTYEVNLVPNEFGFYLARGIAFHMMTEGTFLGQSREEITFAVLEKGVDQKALTSAWKLFDAYSARYAGSNIKVVGAEKEFLYPIPGSPHGMVGKIDQILDIDGELWAGETKTNNGKKSYQQFVDEWSAKRQADFELIGSHSLGLPVVGVFIRIIRDISPVDVWEIPIRLNGPAVVRRTDHDLERTKYAVHQTCETIQMYRKTFGIVHPWPHLSNWPCHKKEGPCEYGTICGRSLSDIHPADLAVFKPREEHLQIVRDTIETVTPESVLASANESFPEQWNPMDETVEVTT